MQTVKTQMKCSRTHNFIRPTLFAKTKCIFRGRNTLFSWNPSMYTMDNPYLIVSNFMEKSIDFQRVKHQSLNHDCSWQEILWYFFLIFQGSKTWDFLLMVCSQPAIGLPVTRHLRFARGPMVVLFQMFAGLAFVWWHCITCLSSTPRHLFALLTLNMISCMCDNALLVCLPPLDIVCFFDIIYDDICLMASHS